MNVTSLKLSEELYGLSGWEPRYWHYKRVQTKDGVTHQRTTPKYNLGYLLRKLEIRPDWKHGRFELEHCYDDANGFYWYASYNSLVDDYPFGQAETPEDAVAKLAIELFKQGVLTNG